MAPQAAGTLRNRILNTLRDLQADDDRGELVLPAFTAASLADAVGISTWDAENELAALARLGKVTTRRPRSGEVFYKLADVHHTAWQSVARGY